VVVAVISDGLVEQAQLNIHSLTTAHDTQFSALIPRGDGADVIEEDANRVEAVAPKGSRICRHLYRVFVAAQFLDMHGHAAAACKLIEQIGDNSSRRLFRRGVGRLTSGFCSTAE